MSTIAAWQPTLVVVDITSAVSTTAARSSVSGFWYVVRFSAQIR
jgi:hypothetical protein